MINRFDTFLPNDYSFNVYTPQVYTPDLSMLDSLLSGVQTEYTNNNDQLSRIMPNYLRNSETDIEAANQFRSKYDKYIEDSTNAFAEGDIQRGRSLLSEGMREVERDKLPGGDYFELERRLKEYTDQDAALQKLYIDEYESPELYQYAKAKLDAGISPFKDIDTGQYGSIGRPNMAKYIPQEEVVDQLDQIIDNISADQIVYGGYRGRNLEGVSFKQLLERGELEKIDYDKVAYVLANAVDPEMQLSYQQLGEALGLEGNQGEFLNSPEEVEETGSLFKPTMLGNTVEALAKSKVYRKQKDKSKIITDEFSRSRALKRAEEQDEYMKSLRTQLYTKGSGMPGWDKLGIQLDENGKVKKMVDTGEEDQFSRAIFGYGTGQKKVSGADNIPYKEYLNKNIEKLPELQDTYYQFKDHIDTLDDKKAYEFMQKKYKEKQDRLSIGEDVVRYVQC
jgi:hypothetical protein